VIPPASFMPMLRKVCDEHGILLVADEVQSGFGRTGRMFASRSHRRRAGHHVPRKSARQRHADRGDGRETPVMRAFHEGEHGTTYGGNAVACAAAIAVIQTLTRDRIPERADRLGRTVMERARAWQADIPRSRDVRGLGLMIGLEFMQNGAPAPRLVDRIVTKALARGVLLAVLRRRRQRHPPDPAADDSRVGARCRPRHPGRSDARGDRAMTVVSDAVEWAT